MGCFVGCQNKTPTNANKRDQGTTSTPARSVLSLQVNVSGFKSDEGTCRIALYLGPQHFNDPEYAAAKESIEIRERSASLRLELAVPDPQGENLPSQLLAICAYHDQNGNARLDKNAFGIPTEPYGFSKNPERGFGPPKFGQTAIVWNAQQSPNHSTFPSSSSNAFKKRNSMRDILKQ